MSRVWFASELETVASYWRLMRRDGVTLGFTTHDDDLRFDGVVHRAAPGMVPSSVRRSADFQADSAEVQGAISHEAISAVDLAAGRFDGARVVIGLVDWQTLERQPIYRGTIGTVTEEAHGFTAELQSRKLELQRDPVPRTSPTCRANFCGPGCGLSAAKYSREVVLSGHDLSNNAVVFLYSGTLQNLVGGSLRWLEGPYAGLRMGVIAVLSDAVILDAPIDVQMAAGLRAVVREGCDHTLETCATRFANAVNFQGEPFLPGNDLLVRYGGTQ